MKNTRLSSAAVNAQADAVSALLAGGFIDLYDGAQPSTGDAPIGSQRRLVSCQLGTPAFNPATAGVCQLTSPALGVGLVTGDATWYRMFAADHVTPVQDGTVGTTNANLVLTSAHVTSGGPVRIDAFVLTQRKSD